MTALLGMDTAASVLGVGLWVDGEVRTVVGDAGAGSETRLLPAAEELLLAAGIAARDLAGVVAAAGPGAFTGLRVGLSTAGGLAQALGRPLVPISSLAARAHAARWPPPDGAPGPVLAMMDARKGRVYAQPFTAEGPAREPGDVPPEEAVGWMTGAFRATGAGALRYRGLVEQAGGQLVANPAAPGIEALLELGAAALAEGRGIDPAAVRPQYLRAPDAVRR